jgi:hypothetical protein
MYLDIALTSWAIQDAKQILRYRYFLEFINEYRLIDKKWTSSSNTCTCLQSQTVFTLTHNDIQKKN